MTRPAKTPRPVLPSGGGSYVRDADGKLMTADQADAEAAAIYASAYNKSGQSKELYGFIKSMETFESTFDKETSVILSTNSELYKYLKSMK